MSFIKSVVNVLTTPVPLPEFLYQEVNIPYLTDAVILPSARPKKKRVVRRRAKKAKTASTREIFSLEGLLHHGENSAFAINGEDFTPTEDTWIFGELRLGALAKVKGIVNERNERVCTSIVVS